MVFSLKWEYKDKQMKNNEQVAVTNSQARLVGSKVCNENGIECQGTKMKSRVKLSNDEI